MNGEPEKHSGWYNHWLPLTRVIVPLAVISTFLGFSNAECELGFAAVIFCLLLLWALTWPIRLGIWLWRRRSGKARMLSNPWLSWLIEPAFIALMAVLIAMSVPFWARFTLSLPSLNKFVEEGLHRPSSFISSAPKNCGLFHIYLWGTGIDKSGKPQVLMVTANDTATDAAGLAYVPSGAEPGSINWGGPHYFDHLFGPWWRLRLDF